MDGNFLLTTIFGQFYAVCECALLNLLRPTSENISILLLIDAPLFLESKDNLCISSILS